MSIFKNENEKNYVGGRKHWTDVIKNTGPEDALIWRQPEEDFNNNSTLIVMPGEEAIFIDNGVIVQTFGNGKYTLSTENYPFISRLKNAFSGGVSRYNCVVYFIRKTHTVELLWGSDSPIQVRDKIHDVRTDAKVRASYKIQIENSSLFIENIIGNNVNYSTQEDIKQHFKYEFQSKIRTVVSQFLNSYEQELIGLDAHLGEISEKISPLIDTVLVTYGLKCVAFSLAAIDIDTEKYDKIDEYQIERIGKQKEALGDVEVMNILGDNWEKQQQINIQKELAKNPGAGGIASVGAGIGMGMAAREVFNSVPSNGQAQNTTSNKAERLKELKELLELECITQEDYDKRKQEILSEI